MGFVFSKIFSGIVGNDQMRIIIIGLDNAGKTTILCKCSSQGPARSAATARVPFVAKLNAVTNLLCF